METRIRRAAGNDAADVANLLGELGYPASAGEVAERIAFADSRPHDNAVFIAERGTRVIGMASVHLTPMFHWHGSLARLTALVVTENVRGTGAGAALLTEVEAYARASGCERLELTSGDARTAAHAFYETRGYARTSQRFVKNLI